MKLFFSLLLFIVYTNIYSQNNIDSLIRNLITVDKIDSFRYSIKFGNEEIGKGHKISNDNGYYYRYEPKTLVVKNNKVVSSESEYVLGDKNGKTIKYYNNGKINTIENHYIKSRDTIIFDSINNAIKINHSIKKEIDKRGIKQKIIELNYVTTSVIKNINLSTNLEEYVVFQGEFKPDNINLIFKYREDESLEYIIFLTKKGELKKIDSLDKLKFLKNDFQKFNDLNEFVKYLNDENY